VYVEIGFLSVQQGCLPRRIAHDFDIFIFIDLFEIIGFLCDPTRLAADGSDLEVTGENFLHNPGLGIKPNGERQSELANAQLLGKQDYLP